MKIGSNIKKLRELRDFSQQALALDLNSSQKQMSRIENDEVSPTLDLVSTICKVLGVSLQELLDFTESKIFNNINSKQKGGENITYNNTEIKQVQDLYEKLLAEKERTIEILQKQMK